MESNKQILEKENDTTHKMIIKLLDESKTEYKLFVHEPVFTSEQAAIVRKCKIESGAKAIFIVNKRKNKDGKRTYYLVVMSAIKQIDFKLLKKGIGSKKLSFAKPDIVKQITGCLPGAVPPFGSVFNIQTYVDPSLQTQGELINFNCGLRTHSVQMKAEDYIDLEKPIILEFTKKIEPRAMG